jgi:hypothetical protein
MPDFSAIPVLIASMKTAYDIAGGFSDLKTQAEVQGKVIHLQQAIMGAQNSAMTAQLELNAAYEEAKELKEIIKTLENWNSFAANYELKEISKGIFVRSYVSSSDQSKPQHWLCPNCFADKKESIIQLELHNHGLSKYLCPRCNFKFSTGEISRPVIPRRTSPYWPKE